MTPPITRRSFLKALVIAPAVPILPALPIELPAAEPEEKRITCAHCGGDTYDRSHCDACGYYDPQEAADPPWLLDDDQGHYEGIDLWSW